MAEAWLPIWTRFRQDRLAVLGASFIILLVLLAIAAPILPLRDPLVQHLDLLPNDGRPLPPGTSFLLGSDPNGRDLLSRLIFGARTSLFIGFVANFLALVAGVAVGSLAGFFRGWWDTLLMRFTDIMMAFPVILFATALISIIQAGSILVLVAVIAVFYWTAVARIVRSQVLSLREKEFVESARSTGGSAWHILRKHILPHLSPVLIVYGTIGIASTISVESTLSFIGIGVQPPTPDWGNMVAEGQDFMLVSPGLVIFPGLAILMTVLAFNLVGDSLRDALDPRSRSLLRGARGGLFGLGSGTGRAEPVELETQIDPFPIAEELGEAAV
ncbi:MAG: ABC transporter permease [Candidatus Dormibacteria bacterium]